MDQTFFKNKSWFLEPTIQSAFPYGLKIMQFNTVCLGGTFDHMHYGHLFLLTQAALVTKKKMIIGVTCDAMLSNKKFKEAMMPIKERMESVRDFMIRLRGDSIELDIFELTDPIGKAGTEKCDACILTKEVEKGG